MFETYKIELFFSTLKYSSSAPEKWALKGSVNPDEDVEGLNL